MARAFGALQSHMLDHACAELKATLSEAETLARTTSASEAITLQAKAVRRGYESYAEHLRELGARRQRGACARTEAPIFGAPVGTVEIPEPELNYAVAKAGRRH